MEESQLITLGREVVVGKRVEGVTGVGGSVLWEGRKWGRGGFSILLWYFSVCRSFFPFLSFFSPLAPWMETRLSRLSGDRQYGPDNGLQSKVVVGEWREGQGHRGREGQNSALVCRARTLYSITSVSLVHTHTFSYSSNTDTHTHTTLISPF